MYVDVVSTESVSSLESSLELDVKRFFDDDAAAAAAVVMDTDVLAPRLEDGRRRSRSDRMAIPRAVS